MKRIKALSITLALTLVFSLMPLTAFAADGSKTVMGSAEAPVVEEYDGSMAEVDGMIMKAMSATPVSLPSYITALNLNSGTEATAYITKKAANYNDSQSCTVNMPAAGTLAITHASSTTVYPKVDGKSRDDNSSVVNDGVTVYTSYWYLSAGNHTLNIPLSSAGNQVILAATYAPAKMNITAATTRKLYILGRPADKSKVSSYKIKVTRPGYLDLMMGDEIRTYGIDYKMSGFSGYETMYNSDARRYIGVKKYTYTVNVKTYTPMYGVKVKLNKITEAKYGTKKSTAATLKNNTTKKGLIITNAKKVHWYKFKNPKTKTVRVYVKSRVTNGGSYGGIKVTMYDSRGEMGSSYLTPNGDSVTIKPYTIGKGSKLVAGTYRIKVESYKGGSGYFTVRWK